MKKFPTNNKLDLFTKRIQGFGSLYRLTASFEIEISRHIRVRRAEDDALRYSATIDGFDVEIVLIPDGGASFRGMDDTLETRAISRMSVSVSRDEDSTPPKIGTTREGGRDFTERSEWFSDRPNEYRAVAVKAVNRMVRFCTYVLYIPDLREFHVHDGHFANPKWIGADDSKLASGVLEFSAKIISSRGLGLLGEKDFIADHDVRLHDVLQNDLSIETHQEFLADARTSIVNGHLRRAILEMAIACEVAIKQLFFKETTTAGAAYEYLESKRRVNVRAIDLIHGVAKEVFGESFKDVASDAYGHIDLLFRSRNKVAHRGKAIYRDDGGEHTVDRHCLEEWWPSVDLLMNWIAKHQF